LYWAGYQGRFASFRWPCAYLPPNTLNPFLYNVGEFYAYKSAAAFKTYLTYLRNNTNRLAGYSIDIIAHSQGNVVASEALEQGAPFDNYILSQGAIPAHCYDTNTNNVPFLQKFIDAETDHGATPLSASHGGYDGYFTNLTGNLVNFYNTNDFALISGATLDIQSNWEENQRARKPEDFTDSINTWYYFYIATNQTCYVDHNSTNGTVTDLQEAKAMVARSRSHAIGAEDNAHGVISSSVDLINTFGFGKTRPEHSAEFSRDIQDVRGYYDEVMRTFNPATP